MDLEIDPSKILYSVGAVLASISIIYLISSQIELSPLTKSLMLLSAFIGLYFTGQIIDDREISIVTFALSGITAVAFVLYTAFVFDLSSSTVLLILAVSAVVFMLAGYNLERLKEIEWPLTSTHAVLAVAVLGLAFIGLDASAPDLEYNYEWEEMANITEEKETVLGQVTVSNNFYLPRPVDSIYFDACVYTPEKQQLYTDTDSYDGLLWEGETTQEVAVRSIRRAEDEAPVNGTFPVEVVEGECPAEADERKIVISKRELTTP